MEVFADLYNSIPGRLKAETVRKTLYELFDLWAKWGVFSQLLCQNLRYMFTSAYQEEVMLWDELPPESTNLEEMGDCDGENIAFDPYWNPRLFDSSLDGNPIERG